MSDDTLVDLAAAVADGVPVDWMSATQTLGTADERQVLDGLKLIADVTSARGVVLHPPPGASAPDTEARSADAQGEDQRWGPLRIIEQVGRGTFGDVYRAWDT